MKDTPENKVKKQIQDLLRADGWFVQSSSLGLLCVLGDQIWKRIKQEKFC